MSLGPAERQVLVSVLKGQQLDSESVQLPMIITLLTTFSKQDRLDLLQVLCYILVCLR